MSSHFCFSSSNSILFRKEKKNVSSSLFPSLNCKESCQSKSLHARIKKAPPNKREANKVKRTTLPFYLLPFSSQKAHMSSINLPCPLNSSHVPPISFHAGSEGPSSKASICDLFCELNLSCIALISNKCIPARCFVISGSLGTRE